MLEIERTIRLPRSVAPVIAQQLMDIADRCPVQRVLSGEIKVRTCSAASDVHIALHARWNVTRSTANSP